MKITVIGSGYVGLVVGTCLANTGQEVTCLDIDQKKIDMLNEGRIPIYEPGLADLVQRNTRQGNLSFTTDVETSIASARVIFIAVGTPQDEDGSADLSYVLKVAETIGKNLSEYKVIVNKSTVPVGTADKVKDTISSLTKTPFDVVSNPEFLKEGAALDDFLKPDRIVIGTESEKARRIMEEIYAPFLRNNHPVYFMDIRSAEITKYASNTMLATRISFMNEIANFCDAVGADINAVRKGIGSDRRIGSAFLYPGIGFGGSCFPKDVKAFGKTAVDHGCKLEVLDAVDKVNQAQKSILFTKIKKHYGNDLKGKHFALWGLAFKPETDDIREAPSLVMIEALLGAGATVTVHDPEAMTNVKNKIGDSVAYADNFYDCLKDADALLILTEWLAYRNPDFDKVKSLMKAPVIFDGRNVFSTALRKSGFTYHCIGANRDMDGA